MHNSSYTLQYISWHYLFSFVFCMQNVVEAYLSRAQLSIIFSCFKYLIKIKHIIKRTAACLWAHQINQNKKNTVSQSNGRVWSVERDNPCQHTATSKCRKCIQPQNYCKTLNHNSAHECKYHCDPSTLKIMSSKLDEKHHPCGI